MTEEAILVTGLITEKCILSTHAEYRKYPSIDLFPTTDGNVLLPQRTIERFFAPIHPIARITGGNPQAYRDSGGNPEYEPVIERTYIAYTDEVQKLLHMPFDMMKSERERADSALLISQSTNASDACEIVKLTDAVWRFECMSLWQRIKFLWDGNI